METLYLFNPENDMALACGDPYYIAPANARRMAAELSALPAWYADEGAAVWVDACRYAQIMKNPFPLPLPVEWVTGVSPIYNKVYPWGWSPALVHHLREAGVEATVCPSGERMNHIRRLSGRHTAVEVLSRIRRGGPVCPPDGSWNSVFGRTHGSAPTVGESFILHSLEEVEAFVLSHPTAILKAPWSGSGRGIQYTSGVFPAALKGWVHHILTTQQTLVGEPFYDKVLDFAMEFLADAEGEVRFVGYSIFETDGRGSYKENRLALDADLERQLAAYVPIEALRQLRMELSTELADVIKGDYEGYLGVDMMICRTVEQGREGYAIHPCVEINLRMNMGVVSRLIYDKYVCRGAHGRYVIEYYPHSGEAEQAHSCFRQQYPLRVVDGRIKSGYLSLTPVGEDTAYQAYVIVEE
ncbi:MAG: hypothetical protein LUI85_16990 [Bacteroides sp.]|nr:hypothetical protein [Bacteroides sp.]